MHIHIYKIPFYYSYHTISLIDFILHMMPKHKHKHATMGIGLRPMGPHLTL